MMVSVMIAHTSNYLATKTQLPLNRTLCANAKLSWGFFDPDVTLVFFLTVDEYFGFIPDVIDY